MPRSISSGYRLSTHSVFSDDVDLIFLTISHDTLLDPLRVVRDTKDYVYDGETWTGFPFEISILSDTDEAPSATLEIQNVDLIIGETIHNLMTPPRLKLELLSSDDFDLTVDPRVEIGTPSPEYVADKLFLANVRLDALTVSGEIVGWDYVQRTWPGIRATQNRLPGLFR
jgi:hypothetical protein